MTRTTIVPVLVLALVTLGAAPARAQWMGFVDKSKDLKTDGFSFGPANPEAGDSNQNYYDGDFGDVDGDGLPDRNLVARYGLLFNTGGGFMTAAANKITGFQFGDKDGIGNDGVQITDIDNDGDLDSLQGGNGEALTLQINRRARFNIKWKKSGASALNIVNTDVEGDGDVDIVVAHSFCVERDCGGPVDFSLFVNDGTGNLTEESKARGLPFKGNAMLFVTGIVSGDVDGDGDYDILIERGDGMASAVVVAKNDGAGHYTVVAVPGSHATCSGFGQGMNLGDVDDDGDLDLLSAACGMPSVNPKVSHQILLNDGKGGFTDASATHLDAAGFAGVLTGGDGKLVDVDYDGDLDFVAMEKNNMASIKHLHVMLNDGKGKFRYDDGRSFMFGGPTAALGNDVDITDLDGDGSYDVWVGLSGESIKILLNSWRDPGGLPADLPRGVRVVSTTAGEGITIGWKAPPFAANARSYRIWRATAPGLHRLDHQMIKVVGQRHQDEGFAAPITRHTTTAYLKDPDVTIDVATGEIRFTDRSAQPGIAYYYAVTHVGTEYTQSALSAEVGATLPPAGGADTTSPFLEIVSPTDQDWSAFPRIVLQHADGGSGIDPASLKVSFDAALGNPAMGGRAAGADIADLFQRRDGGVFVAALLPPLQLPMQMTPVTLTASIADKAGKTTTAKVSYFVSVKPGALPKAMLAAMPGSGMAPLAVGFDASGSTDSDGKILRWEWYFGDGTSGVGRTQRKVYGYGGTYDVTLVVRDNDGGVGVATAKVTVAGPPAPDGGAYDGGPGGGADDGGAPDGGGSTDGRADGGGQGDGAGGDAGGAASGGGCGCRVGGRAASTPAMASALALTVAAVLGARRRRRP